MILQFFRDGYISCALCDDKYASYFVNNTNDIYFQANKTNTSSGGCSASNLSTLTGQFDALFPSEWNSNRRPVSICMDNGTGSHNTAAECTSVDWKTWLPAEFEILGKRVNANPYEQNNQTHFTYYKNGNSVARYFLGLNGKDKSKAVAYWTRSPVSGRNDYWTRISDNLTSQQSYATWSWGLAPCWAM